MRQAYAGTFLESNFRPRSINRAMIRMIAPNIIRLIFFNILGDLKPITDKFDDISF